MGSDTPDIGDTTANDPAPPNRTRRYGLIALAVAALLVVVALGAELVRSDTDTAAQEPLPAIATPEASPTPPGAGDPPTPLAPSEATPRPLPTAATIPTPAPTPPPDPSTSSAPTPPGVRQWTVAGTDVVAVTADAVWMPEDGRYLYPDGISSLNCHLVTDDAIVAIVREEPTEQTIAMTFSMADRRWDRHGPLPATPISDKSEYVPCAAAEVDDTIVFATATLEEFVFVVSDDGGRSFRTSAVSFPTDVRDMDRIVNVEVRQVVRHNDELVLRVCTWYTYDTSCPVHVLRVQLEALLQSDQAAISWSEADGRTVNPSAVYAGRYMDTFSGHGMDGDAIEVVAIGHQTWRMERYNTVIESYLDYSYEQGSWAAGPLDEEPVPFPRGLEPQLFTYGDTAVAMVPLAQAPSPYSTEVRYWVTKDWWIYDRDSSQWAPLTVAPHVEYGRVPAQVPAPGSLFVHDGESLAFIPEEVPPAASWDEVMPMYSSSPIIAGDTAYTFRSGRLWASGDRGNSWTPLFDEDLADSDSHLRWSCTVTNGESVVAPLTRGSEIANLLVINGGIIETVELPRRAQPLGGNGTLLPPCRPVQIDDVWHLATLDRKRKELIIDSITDQGVTERRIDLRGEWSDALSRFDNYAGFVDLHQDGDRVVAHICSWSTSEPCVFDDISFHKSLLSPGSPTSISAQAASETIPPLFFTPNDHPMGGAEQLFQVGDELWRADQDQAVDDCVCGEGGDLAPYYSWVGGEFAGEPESAGTRTTSFLLFNGQVLRCGSDAIPDSAQVRKEPDFVEPDTTRVCMTRNNAGEWQPVFGPVAVDWETVPAGTDVTFVERDEDGRILVTPS